MKRDFTAAIAFGRKSCPFGKVTGITNFGAFVELPEGSTGLVHISEVADNYVKDINEHLKVGDQVEVKVIKQSWQSSINLRQRYVYCCCGRFEEGIFKQKY